MVLITLLKHKKIANVSSPPLYRYIKCRCPPIQDRCRIWDYTSSWPIDRHGYDHVKLKFNHRLLFINIQYSIYIVAHCVVSIYCWRDPLKNDHKTATDRRRLNETQLILKIDAQTCERLSLIEVLLLRAPFCNYILCFYTKASMKLTVNIAIYTRLES